MSELNELKNMLNIIQSLSKKVEAIDESVGARDLSTRSKMSKLKAEIAQANKLIERNLTELKILWGKLSSDAKAKFKSEFPELMTEEEQKVNVVKRTVSGLPPARKTVEDYPIRKDTEKIAPALQSESVRRAIGIGSPIPSKPKAIYSQPQQTEQLEVEQNVERNTGINTIRENQTPVYSEPVEIDGEAPNAAANRVVKSTFNNARAFRL